MNRTPLSSSTIVSVGYEVASATLEVEFTDGHVYQYFDVPQSVYAELVSAPSAGAYLNANIKGIYRYARV